MPKSPLLRKCDKIGLAVAFAALVATIAASAGFAGTPIPQPPAKAQAFVPDAAKVGFNPQPEPPRGFSLNTRMFNPQPEPPRGFSLNTRMFNPQPEPPAPGSAVSLNPQPEPPSLGVRMR
ncbi:MAG: hypothetical protein LJE68_00190 [Rhodobacter sp.]|nr:hypothetical protein [Rhodobacter sp.]